MELLSRVKEIFTKSNEFMQVKNYYFENHKCSAQNDENIKVNMDVVIQDDTDEDMRLRVGMCPHCNKAFFYYGAK